MTAPAAKQRKFLAELKQTLDTSDATPQWREWINRHSDLIASSNLPLHVFRSHHELGATLSNGCWSDPHPHADLVPLLDALSSQEEIARLQRLTDAFNEFSAEATGVISASITREAALRQMALATYGTLYLRGQMDFESWYRHGLFWEARFQFRDLTTRRLIAEDFTLWLARLRDQGATRLSVQVAAVAIDAAVDIETVERSFVVHFPNREQRWFLGDEKLATSSDADRDVPDAAYYAAAIDKYWLIGESQPVASPSDTDWRATYEAIRRDLLNDPCRQIQKPLANYAPYRVYTRAENDWGQLPVLPDSPKLPLPHQLLELLDTLRAGFDNDSHPKNEGNMYVMASEAEIARLDDWSRRLDAWIATVQVHAANETRWLSGATDGAQDEAAVPAVAHRTTDSSHAASVENAPSIHSDPESQFTSSTASGSSDSSSDKSSVDSIKGLGWAVAFVVLTLFVVACAKIVVAWPWLAVPVALVLVLIGKYRSKRSR